ncbi:hypothetical protein [Rhodococcus sp. NPDC004095]
MSGTKAGGLKAARKNKELHGEDFYKKIGAKGGATPTQIPKGFAANPKLASFAGTKGGHKSRRGKSTKKEVIDEQV